MSLATWVCFIGALQSSAVTIFMERHNPEAWALGLDSRLFASVYAVSKKAQFAHLNSKAHIYLSYI